MAEALAIIFLVLGFACQFMLTTAKFTAGIEGIIFLTISLVLCLYTERQSHDQEDSRIEHRIVAALAAIMIIVHVVQLPENYEMEKQYHRAIEHARALERQQIIQQELDAAKE